MEKKISCGEIWCGIHGNDIHVTTSGIEASLFSSACDGGKGGDIYYFSVCDSDLLSRIAIADVMGHGKAVAETSQWMCDSLKDKMNNVQGNEVLADLNAAAVDYGYKALTTAAAIGWYREQKKLFFSYAGHPPVFARRTGDDHWWRLELPKSNHAANLPLGVGREFSFEQSAITLASGDALFFYTDGLLEAEDAQGQPFGNQQLPAVLNAHGTDPQIVKESVLSALGAFTGGGQWSHDDVTFMAIRIR